MALTTQALILVKQKAQNALRNAGGFAAIALKAFWMGLRQRGFSSNLYFLPLGDETVDRVGVDAACKIFGIYLRKGATATAAFFKIFDDATNDATAADAVINIPLYTASEDVLLFFPSGLPLATGLVLGSYTANLGYNGTTASTSGDGPASGFIIVGDA